MLTLQVMACIGIITGTFLLFRIRLDDFTGNIFKRLLNGPKGIREEILDGKRNPICAGRLRKYREYLYLRTGKICFRRCVRYRWFYLQPGQPLQS